MSEVETQAKGKSDDGNKRRSTYSGEFKAEVLSKLISGKKTLKELADEYVLHPNQIKNWKSRLLKEAGTVLEDKRRKGNNRE